MSESNNEIKSEPMASDAASLRYGCFRSAITPDATMGVAGISHRMPVIVEAANCGVNAAVSCIKLSPLHPVHLVEFSGAGVAMDGDDEAQADGSLSRGHGDRENGKHHS